jgi:hypothetical protein
MSIRISRRQFVAGTLAACSHLVASPLWAGPPQPPPDPTAEKAAKRVAPAWVPVPGTGRRIAGLGDDFEDEKWTYYPAGAKSSFNIDKNQRLPGGISSNSLWAEAALRGQPDVVKRVATPPGGIEGSKGSMMLRSFYTGIPGRPSYQVQQDDFLHNTGYKIRGGKLPISWTPNVITRVYMPNFKQWERRTGNSFGFRAGLRATHKHEKDGAYDYEEYWPGFFINFQPGNGQTTLDSAHVVIRSDEYGRDLPGPRVKDNTWYTFGMSFTPEGYVHYFMREGVQDLTREDYVVSYRPYNYRPLVFETFFYNTVNLDDGRTWSTPWIIDDSWLYVSNAPQAQAAQPSATPSYR